MPGLPVAHDILVVPLQEVHRRTDGGGVAGTGAPGVRRRGPVSEAADLLPAEAGAGRGDPGAYVAHRQGGPGGQVLRRRRAVADEVAPGELRHRPGAGDDPRPGRPFVQERPGVLLAAREPAADQSVQLGIHEDVRQPLAGDADTALREDRGSLGAGHVAAAPQRGRQQRPAPLECGVVQPQLPEPRGHAGAHAGCRRRKQHADVLRPDEVPGGAQHVSAQDGAVGVRAIQLRLGRARHAPAYRPLGLAGILRLDRHEPTYDVLRDVRQGPPQALVAQPPPHDVVVAHFPSLQLGSAAGPIDRQLSTPRSPSAR